LNKPTFKNIWLSLPKFICEKIWLAHNRALFSQEKSFPSSGGKKAFGILVEHLNSITQRASPPIARKLGIYLVPPILSSNIPF
jgi:hypothetical protein